MSENDKLPLISILICNYNYDEYVQSAIDSAIKQTYENTELIIIDDGSTDNSVELINDIINKNVDSVVRFKKEKKNKGICYARNKALSLARGEFFIFLDSDNIIPDDFISNMHEEIIKTKSDVVYCDMEYFGDREGKTNLPEFDLNKLLLGNYIDMCSLAKKNIVSGHIFDKKLNRISHEDYDFWLGVALSGAVFSKAKNTYFKYRIQNKSRNLNSAGYTYKYKINQIETWKYILDKYLKMYPEKINETIYYDQLIDQTKISSNEIERLNHIIHSELMPELKVRQDHILSMDKIIVEKDQRINNLEKELEDINKLPPVRIMRVVKKISENIFGLKNKKG